MKFSIKDFVSNCDQIKKFTEEILNGKLHFLCSESYENSYMSLISVSKR